MGSGWRIKYASRARATRIDMPDAHAARLKPTFIQIGISGSEERSKTDHSSSFSEVAPGIVGDAFCADSCVFRWRRSNQSPANTLAVRI